MVIFGGLLPLPKGVERRAAVALKLCDERWWRASQQPRQCLAAELANLCSYGLNRYGLHSYDLCSYGLYSYGLYSYAQPSQCLAAELSNLCPQIGTCVQTCV